MVLLWHYRRLAIKNELNLLALAGLFLVYFCSFVFFSIHSLYYKTLRFNNDFYVIKL